MPLMLLALASCGSGDEERAANSTADIRVPAAGSTLEQTAIDAGLVAEADTLSPVGLYRQRHEAGLDSLCVVGGKGGETRFGLEATFGRGVDCHGRGTLVRSRDRLMLTFAGSACRIEVTYEGDQVTFPGTIDAACSHLCTERGSLEGVSFPRVSREDSVARVARAQDRTKLGR